LFEQKTFFRELGNVRKLDVEIAKRIARGTARAADIINGALKRFSSNELLHARTGTLARMWSVTPDETNPMAFIIRNPLPYAAILNRGGDIRAKKTALAIPIGDAVTERGVAKWAGPREAEAALGVKFFVWKSKRGNAFLAASINRQLTPLFLLRGEVTIPARHYVEAAIDSVRDRAVDEVRRALTP
jgi:phage gpG-like protein